MDFINRVPMLIAVFMAVAGAMILSLVLAGEAWAGHAGSAIHELTVNRPLVVPPPPVATAPRPAASHDGTKVMSPPAERDEQVVNSPADVYATSLKLDELTALCRFVADAVSAPTPHAVSKLALEAILRQTTARVVG